MWVNKVDSDFDFFHYFKRKLVYQLSNEFEILNLFQKVSFFFFNNKSEIFLVWSLVRWSIKFKTDKKKKNMSITIKIY